MSTEKYRRPDIARAVLADPDREASERSLTQSEIQMIAKEKRIQSQTSFTFVHHQYDAPFFYPNFRVELGRPWENSTNHVEPDLPEEEWGIMTKELKPGYVGAEFNSDGVELDVPPYGAITFIEDDPIVEVTVVGSACVPPGYVQIYGEPVEWKYTRTGVKMRVDNLWGEHLRAGPWKMGLKDDYRDAGLSYALFRTPPCKKITIMAGSQHVMDSGDFRNMRHDAHYAVRHIYVGVQKPI